MNELYEPQIAGNQLTGSIAIAISEQVGPGVQEPKKVIRTTTPWTIHVTLRVEGNLALSLPHPTPNETWEIKAYVESLTGEGPEKEVGSVTIDLAAGRATGVTAAGFPYAEWNTPLQIAPGAVDMLPLNVANYEVCRLTVAAITLDAANRPLPVPHFATAEELVAFYKP